MQAAAHDKEFAAKVGIPQRVAKEYSEADKRRSAKLPAKKGK
jgi:hypothetical protein